MRLSKKTYLRETTSSPVFCTFSATKDRRRGQLVTIETISTALEEKTSTKYMGHSRYEVQNHPEAVLKFEC